MADEYRRFQERPGGCPAYEKDAAVSEVFVCEVFICGLIFLGKRIAVNIYNRFTKRLQGHDIIHPGERFCRVNVGGQLCAHTVCRLLNP
jgi:hypothetical protein